MSHAGILIGLLSLAAALVLGIAGAPLPAILPAALAWRRKPAVPKGDNLEALAAGRRVRDMLEARQRRVDARAVARRRARIVRRAEMARSLTYRVRQTLLWIFAGFGVVQLIVLLVLTYVPRR